MKKIAIIGGIGSGKSEVCKIIENLGGYVIYTDKINKELLKNKDYLKKLEKIFPTAIKNNVADKGLIRKEILQNESKRLALNELAHSEIKQKVDFLIEKFDGKAIFCEIPLIVEAGMVDFFDSIWCVIADNNSRICRIMARDGVSKEDAKKIIDCQKSNAELVVICDQVIENNNNIEDLKNYIKDLCERMDVLD